MESKLLKELEQIDFEIREALGEEKIKEFANAEVLVGCGGCSGTQMTCMSPK